MVANLKDKKGIAELLGLTVRGVECLVAARKIPVLKISRKCVRFDADRVLAALKKFEVKEVV
jgi:hypothetical protein